MTAAIDVPESYNENWPFTGTARLFISTDLVDYLKSHRSLTDEPGTEFDYRSVENVRGNSDIRQSRARILGGCSTCNTMIAWTPRASDLADWVERGATGWTPEALAPAVGRLRAHIEPVGEADRNPHVQDVVDAAHSALGLDRVEGVDLIIVAADAELLLRVERVDRAQCRAPSVGALPHRRSAPPPWHLNGAFGAHGPVMGRHGTVILTSR